MVKNRRQILMTLLFAVFPLVAPAANDSFPDAVTAEGNTIIIEGRVVDRTGSPLAGGAVEIWQTDDRGIYDHPGDSGTAGRDPGFQFYGSSGVDQAGRYVFRTVVPGRYEPRPRHIHVKVKLDGRTLLNTQLYIDNVSFGELSVTPESRISSGGRMEDYAVFDIVVDTGRTGNLRPTRSQAEGPYYPLADVSAFDNDLANIR